MTDSSKTIELRSVSKHFGGVQALRDVRFTAYRGQVSAIVGHNGAGKSTLVNILSGVVRPDAGEILRFGHPVDVGTPAAAKRAGITVVHQELTILPDLSVAENVGVDGIPLTRWGTINRRQLHVRVAAALGQFGIQLNLRARAGTLPLAQQQMIEIARALYAGGDVLVLDEPNSALSEPETEALLAIIRRLASQGTTVILVSHRLEEVFSVADRITVLRDGQTQASWAVKETSTSAVIRAMVGDVLESPEPPPRVEFSTQPVLTLQGLRGAHVGPIDLNLIPGEIVGLVGLEGSGTDTVLRMAGGATPSHGRVAIGDEEIKLRGPGAAIDHGIIYMPAERKTEGLWLQYSVANNITAGIIDRVSSLGFIQQRQVRQQARSWVDRLGVRTPDIRTRADKLSGGNQQKVMLARCLATQPKVLLLSDPTRGVDVLAKVEIHGTLRQLASEGMAICFASSELDEALDLADRLVCMRSGQVVGSGPREQYTHDSLLEVITAKR
jgi:ABC-type sugar transport system ATPase subunit